MNLFLVDQVSNQKLYQLGRKNPLTVYQDQFKSNQILRIEATEIAAPISFNFDSNGLKQTFIEKTAPFMPTGWELSPGTHAIQVASSDGTIQEVTVILKEGSPPQSVAPLPAITVFMIDAGTGWIIGAQLSPDRPNRFLLDGNDKPVRFLIRQQPAVGSIAFEFQGGLVPASEPWTPTVGKYSIVVQPFSDEGRIGPITTIPFEIATPTPVPVTPTPTPVPAHTSDFTITAKADGNHTFIISPIGGNIKIGKTLLLGKTDRKGVAKLKKGAQYTVTVNTMGKPRQVFITGPGGFNETHQIT